MLQIKKWMQKCFLGNLLLRPEFYKKIASCLEEIKPFCLVGEHHPLASTFDGLK